MTDIERQQLIPWHGLASRRSWQHPRTGLKRPHPGEREKKPDEALLFDLLSVWAPDEKVRHRILVENPATLFEASPEFFRILLQWKPS